MPSTLDKKLQKLADKSGPSLKPVWEEEKEEEIIPDLLEVSPDKRTTEQIKSLINLSVTLQQQESEIKKERKPITETLKKLIGICSAPKFQYMGTRVNMFATKRRSLNAQKLIARGVSPELIAACMDETESWTLKIMAAGGEEED